jgi:hypothetical protein
MMMMTPTTSEQASRERSSFVRSSYVLLVCERPASWLLAA